MKLSKLHDHIEEIKKLLKINKSYAEIAIHFGVTKNTVAGFIDRHIKNNKTKKTKIKKQIFKNNKIKNNTLNTSKNNKIKNNTLNTSKNSQIIFEPKKCRYPVSGELSSIIWCNKPTNKHKSWCDECLKIVFIKSN